MANDWILDVLADLKAFAQKNGLSALEHQLDVSESVAARELTSGIGITGQNFEYTGNLHRTNAGSPFA
jgi:predicted transcriptional regulator